MRVVKIGLLTLVLGLLSESFAGTYEYTLQCAMVVPVVSGAEDIVNVETESLAPIKNGSDLAPIKIREWDYMGGFCSTNKGAEC